MVKFGKNRNFHSKLVKVALQIVRTKLKRCYKCRVTSEQKISALGLVHTREKKRTFLRKSAHILKKSAHIFKKNAHILKKVHIF